MSQGCAQGFLQNARDPHSQYTLSLPPSFSLPRSGKGPWPRVSGFSPCVQGNDEISLPSPSAAGLAPLACLAAAGPQDGQGLRVEASRPALLSSRKDAQGC